MTKYFKSNRAHIKYKFPKDYWLRPKLWMLNMTYYETGIYFTQN